MNGQIISFYVPESIGRIDHGNSRQPAGLRIAGRVAYIYGVFDLVSFHDQADVFPFGDLCIAKAYMINKINASIYPAWLLLTIIN